MRMGEINKITFLHYDNILEKERLIDFYGYLDGSSKLLILITTVKSSDIEATIDNFIRKASGLYYLPVTSSSFNLLSHYVKEKYPDTNCVAFTGKHSSMYRLKGKNRPDFNRSIRYYGKDGFETLDEMREIYGIIPKNMSYRIPNYGEFEVSSNGKFSLKLQVQPPIDSKNMLFEIFNFVTADVLKRRKIIDKSKFELIPYKTDTKTFDIPVAIPWAIQFNGDLDDSQLELLKNNFTENNFTLYNETQIIGNSFSLNGMVFDDDKNNIFMIHVDNKKIIIAPYIGENIDSFLRFYEVLSDFDPNAILLGGINE
jgi:hypothetical protein